MRENISDLIKVAQLALDGNDMEVFSKSIRLAFTALVVLLPPVVTDVEPMKEEVKNG